MWLWLSVCAALAASPDPNRMLQPDRNLGSGDVLSSTVDLAWLVWKRGISIGDGSRCPFEPSCSTFARDAIEQRGWTGLILMYDRLERDGSASEYPLAADGVHRRDEADEHLPVFDLVLGRTCRAQRRAGSAACF